MSVDHSLPGGFDDLERFVDHWALPTTLQRSQQRFATSMNDIKQFYEAMLARLDAALDHLDTFKLDALPEREQRLFFLTLSLAEVSGAVEVYGEQLTQYAFPYERYVMTEQA